MDPMPELPISDEEAAALARIKKMRPRVTDYALLDAYLARCVEIMGRPNKRHRGVPRTDNTRRYHYEHRGLHKTIVAG